MSEKLPMPVAPSRGVKAGIKQDRERTKAAKLTGTTANEIAAAGVGVAYSHNFLNQKPWHPLNFRNQIRKFEAEVNAVELARAREKGLAEFEAEQEYMKTLSYLSPEEQQRYRERQSISFMYMKPPGLEAALARDAEAEAKKLAASAVAATAAATGMAAGGTSSAAPATGAVVVAASAAAAQPLPVAVERQQVLDKMREDPFAHILTARIALQNNSRLRLKHSGSSPVHGGFERNEGNQEYLADDGGDFGGFGRGGSATARGEPAGPAGTAGAGGLVDLDDEAALLAALPEEDRPLALKQIRKIKKQREKERQLREAEAVLLAAGYDLGTVAAGAGGDAAGSDSKSLKKRKSKKERDKDKSGKKHKKHKRQRHEGDDNGVAQGHRKQLSREGEGNETSSESV